MLVLIVLSASIHHNNLAPSGYISSTCKSLRSPATMRNCTCVCDSADRNCLSTIGRNDLVVDVCANQSRWRSDGSPLQPAPTVSDHERYITKSSAFHNRSHSNSLRKALQKHQRCPSNSILLRSHYPHHHLADRTTSAHHHRHLRSRHATCLGHTDSTKPYHSMRLLLSFLWTKQPKN